METPFDEFDVKHETTRKEKSSTFMSGIHTIPKKIADIAQTQGVSEKFLENGLPSGIINPSMLAHDRYLSMVDALQDALIISLILVTVPLLPVNWFTMFFYFIIGFYWFFHIAWWEKTKIWAIKGASKKYLRHTTLAYWLLFYTLMLPTLVAMYYFVFMLSGEVITFSYINSFLTITNGAEKAIAQVFGNYSFIANNFSTNPHHSISLSAKEYESGFISVGLIFFSITVLAKVFFKSLYKSESNENIKNAKTELQYVGEAALSTLKDARK